VYSSDYLDSLIAYKKVIILNVLNIEGIDGDYLHRVGILRQYNINFKISL